jgi:hypothetical protein
MITAETGNLARITKLLLIGALLLSLSSCAATSNQGTSSPAANQLGLAPAPLPHYQVGTKFVYSNGTWETVTRIGPEGVTWKNHRGNESTGQPDFTYKRHTWQTRDRRGNREHRQTEFWLGEKTTTLWPLQVGNKTRFDEFGRWFNSSGGTRNYDSYWSCEVEGSERISVVAGDFDTWKITCKRYPNRFRSTSKTREYRTWYYAPSINHWVLEERDYNGYRKNRRKELAAILPDLGSFTEKDEDVVSLKKQFQNTLESSKRGTTDIWENPREQLFVSMTPKKLFRLGNGDVCRQYHQVIGDAGYTFEFPGIACRNGNGRWVVPRR